MLADGGAYDLPAIVAEGLVMLGEQSRAAQLYPLARELIGTGAVGALADLPLHAYHRGCRRDGGSSVGSR
jgi:hypothetical protein